MVAVHDVGKMGANACLLASHRDCTERPDGIGLMVDMACSLMRLAAAFHRTPEFCQDSYRTFPQRPGFTTVGVQAKFPAFLLPPARATAPMRRQLPF